MQKPQNCNQDWSKMTPAEGGKICGSCEKLIVDFRKKYWKEIETKQSKNHHSLCGVYSERQLKYWGKEVPKSNFCSKNLLYASIVLSMNAAVSELHSKTNIQLPVSKIIQTDQQTKQIQGKQEPNTDSITITGKVIDEETGEPLIGVTTVVKNSNIGALTNVNGYFKIENFDKSQHKQKSITLIVTYTGYNTQEIILTEQQQNQQKFIVNPIMLTASSDIVSFSVIVETPWQRFKSRVRRLFRRG